MFGATVLAPILMGFDPNVAILMSGVGTLIFFVVDRGQVPSYLGSSFAFIGVVIAATGYAGSGPNANLGVALGGIIVCGALYVLIGLVVAATNRQLRRSTPMAGLEVEEVETGVAVHWIERVMPPVVTGAVVAVIGLNLASIPIKNMAPDRLRHLDPGVDLRQRRPGRGLHARHGAAAADPGGPDRGDGDLRAADQRHGPGQADRLRVRWRAPPGSARRSSPRRCSAPTRSC